MTSTIDKTQVRLKGLWFDAYVTTPKTGAGRRLFHPLRLRNKHIRCETVVGDTFLLPVSDFASLVVRDNCFAFINDLRVMLSSTEVSRGAVRVCFNDPAEAAIVYTARGAERQA